jgi:two-component system chemotaxis response regulator CheB
MPTASRARSSLSPELIVVVASLGGLDAVSRLLATLPASFAVPIVLVQHGRSQTRPGGLSELLKARTPLPVRTATEGMPAGLPGVTIIPTGRTGTLDAEHRLVLGSHLALGGGDAMLTSAAEALGAGVVAVVLTGRLRDGTSGAQAVKDRGGRVLAQDPSSALAPGMPSSAISAGCVDQVLTPESIARALVTMSRGGRIAVSG